MAKEEAIINYKNSYKKINIQSSQAYYPCEYIDDSKDSYVKAGDDCVRFFFTVMNSFDKGFTYRLGAIARKSWSHIDTSLFFGDNKNLLKAMIDNGFQVYETGAVAQDKIGISSISKDFRLQYGDIIVRQGHLHIYLGNGHGQSDNFGWGKVNRIFPQNYNYSLETDDNKNYYITCDHDIDKTTNQKRKYKRVYRYVGGSNEK